MGDRRRGSARHEDVDPVRMKAQRLVDLAFGHQSELLVRQRAQRDTASLQQPGLELALDLETQLALAASQPAAALEPELPVGRAVSPRLVLDPRLYRHPVNVDARVGGTRAGNDPKHGKNMVSE